MVIMNLMNALDSRGSDAAVARVLVHPHFNTSMRNPAAALGNTKPQVCNMCDTVIVRKMRPSVC